MDRNLIIVSVAVAALSLTGCNRKPAETKGAATPAEQAATPSANPAATVPTPSNEAAAHDFVAKAAASDMFEIASAKLAQTHSKNPQVKEFAAMMIKDHTKSSENLKAAIKASSPALTPPSALPKDKQDAVDDLLKAAPETFDRKYMDGQVDAHQAALNLLQRYAQDGDVARLKTFAAATALVVQTHYDRAKALREALK
jgi:putative membrane protein